MGLICAPTFCNVPNVDLLVSDESGASFVSLQVKTATSAIHERGSGEQKRPHEYQWPKNWTSARHNVPNLFFALVDLKKFTELPDIFIVPSSIIFEYFKDVGPETWKWARYHESIEKLAPYKNAFDVILVT